MFAFIALHPDDEPDVDPDTGEEYPYVLSIRDRSRQIHYAWTDVSSEDPVEWESQAEVVVRAAGFVCAGDWVTSESGAYAVVPVRRKF